jgi:hypothetical protein
MLIFKKSGNINKPQNFHFITSFLLMTYYRNDTPQNFQTSCHKFIDNLGHSIILEVKIAIKCFGIYYVYTLWIVCWQGQS